VKTGGAEEIDGNKNSSKRVSASIGMQGGLRPRAMQNAASQIWLPLPLAAFTLCGSLTATLQLCPTVCARFLAHFGVGSLTGSSKPFGPENPAHLHKPFLFHYIHTESPARS